MLTSQFVFINSILYLLIFLLYIFSSVSILGIYYSSSIKLKLLFIILLSVSSFTIYFNYFHISKNKEVINQYSMHNKEEIELFLSYYLDYNKEHRDNMFLIEIPLSLITKEKGYTLRLNTENLKMKDILLFDKFCSYNQIACQLETNSNNHLILSNKYKSIIDYEQNDFKFAKGYYKEKFLELPYLEKDKNIYKKLNDNGFEVVDYGLGVLMNKGENTESRPYLTLEIYKDSELTQFEKEKIYKSLYLLMNENNITIQVVKKETKEVIENFKVSEFKKIND